MTDTSSDPDENAPESLLRELVCRAKAAGEAVGLYLDDVVNIGGPTQVTVAFEVGHLAFSDRVLDPAAEEMRHQTRLMEEQLRTPTSELRQRSESLAERMRRTRGGTE